MKPQKAGSKRQRATLYDVPESSTDSWGKPSQTPTTIGTFWIAVRPLQGAEQLNVRQIWPSATHIVEMRWLGSAIPSSADNPNSQVMPQMKFQLALDNSILNVLYANNVEKRNRKWEITCAEHVGATN